MYGIAYVIMPTEFDSLQAVLDKALGRFRRGGADEFPREHLVFDDVTDALRRLHLSPIRVKDDATGFSLSGVDPGLTIDADIHALRALLKSRGVEVWTGRLADIEPDFDEFVRRFTDWKPRDPKAGGYGRWLNSLGRWDWWELGGRFDGLVSGQPRHGAGADSMISSGPNRGRDLIGGVVRALGDAPSEVEAEIAANVDLISALLEAAKGNEAHAFPTAIVLPVDSCPAELRWFDSLGWRPIPQGTKAYLSAPHDASFRETAIAAYERFHAMAVAGIAYHF